MAAFAKSLRRGKNVLCARVGVRFWGKTGKIFFFFALPPGPQAPTEVEATGALLQRQDCTLVTWYSSLYAPRTGGAYDSHHRTAGIAGYTRRRGSVAARGACAAGRADAAHRRVHEHRGG